jgi:glutathione synthase/RimK-type ligase-like ATP-grasp enzyme
MAASQILIFAPDNDDHAVDLGARLQNKGAELYILDGARFPSCRDERMEVTPDGQLKFLIREDNICFDVLNLSAIWFRRRTPSKSSHSIHPDDKLIVSVQLTNYDKWWESFVHSQISVPKSILAINDPIRSAVSDNKILQQVMAKKFGLRPLPTIVTNSSVELREFLSCHGPCVRKSLYPFSWIEQGALFCNLTSRIEHVPDDSEESLRLVPEIFQKMINKQREIRFFIVGREIFGVVIKLDTNSEEIDWRVYHSDTSKCRALGRSESHLEQTAIDLVQSFGLHTASVEFFEDPEGNWYLTDINESGQFLWMEDYGLPVGDAFVSYCLSPRGAT